MALGKCLDCGAEVSDTAEKCPKCGRDEPLKSDSAKAWGCFWFILIVIILAVLAAWP